MSDANALPDLSTIFAKVAENPQAMAMLSSLLGGMNDMPKQDGHSQKEEEPAAQEEAHVEASADADVAPKNAQAVLSPIPVGKGRKNDAKRRLLLSLKPFLSPERQQAVSTLLLVLEGISLLSVGKEPPCT